MPPTFKKRTIAYGWRQNQEDKLKIVEKICLDPNLSGSNQQDLDSTIHNITSVIVPLPLVLYWPVNKQVTLRPRTNLQQYVQEPTTYILVNKTASKYINLLVY